MSETPAIAAPPTFSGDITAFIDSPAVEEIVSQMCFEFIRLAALWRETGTEIAHRAEAEQAFFMRRMLHAAADGGTSWRIVFGRELRGRIDQAKALRGDGEAAKREPSPPTSEPQPVLNQETDAK